MPMLSGSASPVRRLFQRAWDDAQRTGSVRGALLATRDGFLVCADCPDVGDLEVFAAMHATALGAAELALHRVGAQKHVTLLAESGGDRFVSRGVTDELFVVAIMDRSKDCGPVIAWIDSLGGQLAG